MTSILCFNYLKQSGQSNSRIEMDNVDQREGNVDDYYDIQETNYANI
ncbi:10589_t:CDS:2 [Funneliformis geosporum]|uniref:10589_t:CDS:1 n=1 Tax=Funneliformis geosporum TaxID=1117311 RepID=A0A9W4SUU8_9GLOM|nr:10589_t:CDS:2 [Funneliformis geosporum]